MTTIKIAVGEGDLDDQVGERLEDRELPDEADMDSFDGPSIAACPYCRKMISEDAEHAPPLRRIHLAGRVHTSCSLVDLDWSYSSGDQLCGLDVYLGKVAMKRSQKLTHLDSRGRADGECGQKPITAQAEAHAEGFITLARSTINAIANDQSPRVKSSAPRRIAGIMAAKRCGELIPLCHPLPVESVEVTFDISELEPKSDGPVRCVSAIAKITAKTGVEMEALTAVTVAALTIYDMCKAIDKSMVIDGVRLVRKTGGTKGMLVV